MTFQSVDIVAPSAVSKSRKRLPWIALALCTLAAVAVFAVVAVAPSDNQTDLPISMKSKAPAATLQDVNADLAGLQDDLNTAIRDLQKASIAARARNDKKELSLKKAAAKADACTKNPSCAKKRAAADKTKAANKKRAAAKAKADARCIKNPECAKKKAADDAKKKRLAGQRKKTVDAACDQNPICVKKRAAAKKKAALKKAALKKRALKKAKKALKKAKEAAKERAKINKLKRFVQSKRKQIKAALKKEQTLKNLLAAHKSKPTKLIVAVATATTEVEESEYSVAQKKSAVTKTDSLLKEAQKRLNKSEEELKSLSKNSDEEARKAVQRLSTVGIPKAIKAVERARFRKAAADDDLARAVARLSSAKSELGLANKRASIE